MKIAKYIIILTVLVGGLVFARGCSANLGVDEFKTRIKVGNYELIHQANDNSKDQLERKRSHKRRKKRKRPIKGLR